MDKFCIYCGAKLNQDANFCTICGRSTSDISQPFEQPSTTYSYNYASAYTVPLEQPRKTKRKPIKRVLISLAVLLTLAALVMAALHFFDLYSLFPAKTRINSLSGQAYANRSITLHGEGFGEYSMNYSRVSIAGIDTGIIAWTDNEISVIVPAAITAGKQENIVRNPPKFDKKRYSSEFQEHNRTKLLSTTLSPSEDNRIDHDDFSLIVPADSLTEETVITIYKYDTPSADPSPYYTVLDEYEITGANGEHVFFDSPVFFGLDVEGEDEAMQMAYQIYDEFLGQWVRLETTYVEEENKLYLATEHFSSLRRFVHDMYQGSKKMDI